MNSKFIQDNILFLILPILVLGAGIYYSYNFITEVLSNNEVLITKREEKITKESKLNVLLEAKRKYEANLEKNNGAKSGKVIFEVLEQQFSPEASFGIMFENILSNVTTSGIRVRSIDYNYRPIEDKIVTTNTMNYNACELSFTAVGTYTQLQTFFKNITKEKYLSNIHSIYIEPYDKNKNILIAKFKLVLYTKTVQKLTPQSVQK